MTKRLLVFISIILNFTYTLPILFKKPMVRPINTGQLRSSNSLTKRCSSNKTKQQLALLKSLLELEHKSEIKDKIKRLKNIEKHLRPSDKDYLGAPWRSDYIMQALKIGEEKDSAQKSCPFCKHYKQDKQFQDNPNSQDSKDYDKNNYILKRFKHCMVTLNLYPYATGHLLIIPNKHCSSLELLDKEARLEIMEVQAASIPILKKALGNHGFNIGVNLGEQGISGASIPQHLHFHIVSRWLGDTSFLTVLANTLIIGTKLDSLYEYLKPYFDEIKL